MLSVVPRHTADQLRPWSLRISALWLMPGRPVKLSPWYWRRRGFPDCRKRLSSWLLRAAERFLRCVLGSGSNTSSNMPLCSHPCCQLDPLRVSYITRIFSTTTKKHRCTISDQPINPSPLPFHPVNDRTGPIDVWFLFIHMGLPTLCFLRPAPVKVQEDLAVIFLSFLSGEFPNPEFFFKTLRPFAASACHLFMSAPILSFPSFKATQLIFI